MLNFLYCYILLHLGPVCQIYLSKKVYNLPIRCQNLLRETLHLNPSPQPEDATREDATGEREDAMKDATEGGRGVFSRGVSHPLGQDPEGPACLAAPPAAVGFNHHGDEGEALLRAQPRGVLVLPLELLVPLRRRA